MNASRFSRTPGPRHASRHALLLALCALLAPLAAHAQTASNTYEDRVEVAWPAGWTTNQAFSVHVFRRALAIGETPDGTRGNLVMVEAAGKGLWADRSGLPMQRYEYCLALKNPAGADQATLCTEGRRVIRPILDAEAGFARPVAAAVTLRWRNTSALPGRTTRIYRSALADGTLGTAVFAADSVLAENLSAATTAYRDTSATPGVVYGYALATVVEGAESERAEVRGQRAVVPGPASFSASDGTDPAAVRLSWTLGEAFAIARFEISRDLGDGNPGVVLASIPATDPGAGAAYSFSDATADPAAFYNYCVTAVTAEGTASAPACDAGSRAGLQPPTAVAATDYLWDDRIEVTWAYSGTTADGFAILRACLTGPADAPCPPGPPAFVEVGRVAKGQRTYADRAAVGEVIYGYQVVAFSSLGGVSAIGDAQRDDGVRAYVLAPTTVAATDGAFEDHVAVSWQNPATTALVFNVTRDGTVIAVVSADGRALTDADVASDVTHSYCVASLTIPDNLPAAAAAALRARVQTAMGRYGSTEGLLPGSSTQANRDRLAAEVEGLIAGARQGAAPAPLPGFDRVQAGGPPAVSAPVCDTGFRSLHPPTAVAASDAADTDDERFVRIAWQDASSVEAGYRIYRRALFDTTTPLALVARTGPNRTQTLDTTAAPGQRYVYVVRAYDNLGPVQTDALGSWGGQSRVADLGGTMLASDEGRRELKAATDVRASDGRFEKQVEITWNDNSAVVSRAGYHVYRWPRAAGAAQPSDAARVCTAGERATSCTDTQFGSADYGVVYLYRVVAFDAYGEALPAPGAADRDEGGTVVLPPADLNASAGYADKVTLAWNDVSRVNTGYRVTVDGQALPDLGDVSTFTHTPGNTASHTYCVVALAGAAESARVCASGKQMNPDGGAVESLFGLELTSSSTPGSAGAGDFFGLNVAVNADNLLAGAPGRNSGSAVLYTRTDGVWQENSVLGGSGTFGRFGESVALTSTQAIVGAPEGSGLNNEVTVEGAWKSNGASGTDTCPGAPRIFPPPQCSWTGQSQRRYRYIDGGAYVYNLQSGALEGVLRAGSGGLFATPSEVDACVVNCPSKPSALDGRDRRVYTSNPYGPTVTNPGAWAEQATWDDTGARAMGKLVAAASRWAFVSGAKLSGPYREELHVFERQGAGWVPRQIIPNVDRNQALAFDGTTMIYSSFGPGFAYYHVYLYDGTQWTQNKLTYFNPRVPGGGAYLAVKDDFIAVATDGGVLVYQRANGVWPDAPVAVLTPPTNATSVALSEADGAYYLVAGDERADGRGEDSGAGYAYLFEGDAWTYIGELLPGTAADDLSGLGLGRSVALDGSNPILGGAYQFSGTQPGALYFGALGRPPSGVAASDGTYENRIQVRWNDRTDIEDGFRVYRSTDTPGAYDLIGSVGADVGVYDDFDAAPGGAYDYCIAAFTLTKKGEEESQRQCDMGWLPADGRIAGRVASRDGAGVAGVDVCLDPSPNRGLLFDGKGGGAVATSLDTLPHAFTLEAWVKRDLNGRNQFFFTQGSLSTNNGLHIGFRDSGNFTVAFYYNDYEVPPSAFPASYDAEAWNHWAVTVDGSDRHVFLNGVELAGTPSPAPAPYGGRGPLHLGTPGWNPENALVGLMDEVRLWRGVRTAAEIRDHMNGALGGGENNLVAYWPLEQIAGTVAPDVTEGRAHLTLANGTFWGGGSDGLEACATTDDGGTYTHAGLRYGDGARFEVRPRATGRAFLPATQTVNLTPESQVENQLNFTDTSVFTFEGQVALGTGVGACPADSVDILVDGQYKATTKADGTYTLSVAPTNPDDAENRSRLLTAQRKGRGGSTSLFSFAPALIDTAATKNLDGLNFAVTTQRTLTGFVGGSCNTVLGAVTLRIYTESGCSDQQVVANPHFTLQLPPQKYFVDVVDVQLAPNSPLSRAGVLAYYDALGTQMVDLTEADATLDLLYHAPVEVTVAGLPAPLGQCSAGIQADGRTLANVPVLAEYDRPLLTIAVQENYGGGQVCAVPGAQVKIFDNIADQGDRAIVDTTDATGKIRYRTFARSPEVTSGAVVDGVDRSYQKSLTASVRVPGRGTTAETVWAIVEGYRERTGEFVSATTAEMPLLVLHDPPGSGSYAYLEEGTTSCSRLGRFQLTGGGAGVLVDAALGFKSAAGIFITIENGAALLLQTKTIFGRNDQRLDGGADSNIEICATTTKRIATSSDAGWVGEDLMVGTALNLKFALADDLAVNACRIDLTEKLATDLDETQPFATTYVYGTTHIERSLIPALENLAGLQDATLEGDEDGNHTIEKIKLSDALANWHRYLARNDSTVAVAFKGRAKYENRSFSGASEFEWSHTADTTRTLRQDVTQIYINSENAIGAVATLVGYDSKFAATFEVRQEWTTERDSTQQNTKTVGYVLADGDAGDFMSVDVGTDPTYGTPAFRTVSGRTSNPWEAGTQRRDWPEISIARPVARGVAANGAASFSVTLKNSSESKERRQYVLGLAGETNRGNLGVMVNGSLLGSTAVQRYTLGPDESVTIQMEAIRAPGNVYDYDDVALIFYPQWEYDYWLGDTRFPATMIDTARFSVSFAPPCSPITLLRPETGWALGAGGAGTLELFAHEFAVAASADTRVGFEYRRNGGPWQTATFQTGTQLAGATELAYTWTPPGEGSYQVRAYAQCKLAGGEIARTETVPVEGTVSQSRPQLAATPQPADGALNLGDDVAIRFTRALDCATARTDDVGGYRALGLRTADSTFVPADAVCEGGTVTLRPRHAAFWAEHEGETLTAFVAPPRRNAQQGNRVVAGLTDGAGNPIADAGGAEITAEIAWAFVVQQSAVAFAPSNVAAQTTPGAPATLAATLANGRPQPVSFTLDGPFKLARLDGNGAPTGDSVAVTPSVTTGQIVPGGQQSIAFGWAGTTGLGRYRATLFAALREGTQALGSAPLEMTVDVACAPPPAWTLAPQGYEFSMTAMVQLVLDGTASQDERDRVAAFVDGELRGTAPLTRFENGMGGQAFLAPLSIHSNREAGEAITVQVWDDSACRLYEATSAAFIFVDGAERGTPARPYTVYAPTGPDGPAMVNLLAGWTWFSTNKTPADPALGSVLDGLFVASGDLVKSQTAFALYDEQAGWAGSLGQIVPGPAYLARLTASNTLVLAGTPADVAGTPLGLKAGWNWVGYLPPQPYPVNHALQHVAAQNDDLVKGQFGFAQFLDGYGWIGSLAEMRPGEGYMIKLHAPATFTYPVVAPPAAALAAAAPLHAAGEAATASRVAGGDAAPAPAAKADAPLWTVDPARFEHSMSITATPEMDGVAVTAAGSLVAAFAPGADGKPEVRGVAPVQYVPALSRHLAFLSVYSNAAEGETLHFEIYDAGADATGKAGASMGFTANGVVGTLQAPVVFDPSVTTALDAGAGIPATFMLLPNRPNPFSATTTIHYGLPQAATVRLVVFDLLGREVMRLVDERQGAGYHAVTLGADALASGVYVYRIEAGDFQATRRMVLVK